MKDKQIEIGSDFSGVGALIQALKFMKLPFSETFACDKDPYARQAYEIVYGRPDYFPEDVYDREIPEKPLDLYVTSPPCQAFSLAGKRLGKLDLRGILFFNSLEFITKNKPRYFVFENVKGLLSHDKDKKNKQAKYGRTFNEWINFLGGKSVNGNETIFPYEDSVPYHIYFHVLNAKHYGVPQNRDRIFIIGIRDDADNSFIFPPKIPLEKRLRDILENSVLKKYFLSEEMKKWLLSHSEKSKEKENGFKFQPLDDDSVAKSVNARYYKMGVYDNYYHEPEIIQINDPVHSNDRIYSDQGISPTLNTMQGGNRQPFVNITEPEVIQINPSKESGGKQPYHQNRIYDSDGISPAILADLGKGNIVTIPEIDDKYFISEKMEKYLNTRKDNFNNGKINYKTEDDIATTLTKSSGSIDISDNIIVDPVRLKIRRLTPRECFRLMDFDESFMDAIVQHNAANPKSKISDSQLYKMAGNSIVRACFVALIKRLNFN